MNNHGSISLKNSSEINRRLKYPVSATANSTVKLRDGNLNLQNNIILTEVTASNATIAAARATAKAASMATSTITNNKNYLNNGDPLEKSVTFQISTLCTIQRTKSDDFQNNSNMWNSGIQTDTVKSSNQKMYTNNEIENVHVSIKPQMNKGTKFEKLRRELELLEQGVNISYKNDINISKINDFKFNKLSDNSIHSNLSTLSSCQSDQPFCYSALSEPTHYLSDSSNATSFGSKIGKSNTQRNSFLSIDNENSDNSSNMKKFKISELKRHGKIINTYPSDMINVNNCKNNKDLSNINKEQSSIHCIKTTPGVSCMKSLTVNEDLGALLLSSSLLPETDIDSGTVSENYFFPQTHFSGDQSPYSFEKTRSLVDLRKNNDADYKTIMSKAISSEDLKKSKHIEEGDLIKHLKSRAQSTQELRIADSLTKLNVPQWMNDFKLSSTHRRDIVSNTTTPKISTMSFKNLKHHDSILSKYKYTSLPLNKSITPNKNQQTNRVVLPSTLYRSKSQNLVYFNPKEDSKLLNHKDENDESIKYTSSLKVLNANPLKNDLIQKPIISDKSGIKIIVNKTEQASKPPNFVSHKEINSNEIVEQENIVRQDKLESEFILRLLINSTQNQFAFDEKLCESFGINPSALKLLLNVKRKTPNLDRDDTFISSKKKENMYIENTIMNNDKNKNYVICNLRGCGKEILQSNKIDRGNCSCYNCYTYYCSKICRNYDFSFHLAKCSFNRIYKMMLKVKDSFSENQLIQLSNFAKINYYRYGEGVVIIAFESCRAADDFLNGQLNRLLSQPYYFSHSEIKKCIPSFKTLDSNSDEEYTITLIMSATLPMTSVELSYPTFKFTFKKNYVDKRITEKEISLGNLSSSKEKNVFSDFEIRKRFFDYVINFFKAKNVQLNLSHSMIYNKLKKYLDDGLYFEPLKIFVKDPITNSTVACVINPNKEITTTIIRNVSRKSNTDEISVTNNIAKTITETEI